jgi:hypothetical protein
MGALIGFFTDLQQNNWLNQLLSGVPYTPPAKLYLGLLTSIPSRLGQTEVAATQNLKGFTDLTVDGAVNTRISSASHPFVAADQSVTITGGAGWTAGTYTIGSITGTAANLNKTPAAAATAGGVGIIVRSTGYARTALPAGIFDLSLAGQTQNNAPIRLPSPTGDWGIIRGIGLYDALTGGNLLAVISTVTPLTVSAGDAARTIAAGALPVSRS